MVPGLSYADHLFGMNADNITRGRLPNERLDPSSVTLLGSNPSLNYFSGVVGSSQILAGITFLSAYNNSVAIGNINTLGVTNTNSQTGFSVSGTTGTFNISSLYGDVTVVVGTSSARGAEIIGSNTEIFKFAIATATARGGGKIIVQDGDYLFRGLNRGTTLSM